MKHFHYIFTGSGLAALMTVYKMVQSGKYKDKTILLLDENPKKTNDRTWCFWEKENQFGIQSFQKNGIRLCLPMKIFNRDLDLQPYQYKMIQGLDFYNLVFELLSKQKNITFLNEKVTDINELENHVYVATENNSFTCDQVFNSIYNKADVENQTKYPVLQQHFIGWTIKSNEAVFNPEQATFMDFSVAQKGNTRFMYVLPTSKTEALLNILCFHIRF